MSPISTINLSVAPQEAQGPGFGPQLRKNEPKKKKPGGNLSGTRGWSRETGEDSREKIRLILHVSETLKD